MKIKTSGRTKTPALRGLIPVAISLLLAGCNGAPSVDIVGSFFPAWMVCMTIAVVLTFVVRAVLVRLHLEMEVGPLALFYPSLLTLLTSVIWLGYFK